MMVEYNHARLEILLGGPLKQIPEDDLVARMTAKALVTCLELGAGSPTDRLSRALYYVERAVQIKTAKKAGKPVKEPPPPLFELLDKQGGKIPYNPDPVPVADGPVWFLPSQHPSFKLATKPVEQTETPPLTQKKVKGAFADVSEKVMKEHKKSLQKKLDELVIFGSSPFPWTEE